MDAPPASPPPGGELHLWHVPLEVAPEQARRLGALLDAGERARMARLHAPADRRRFAVAHGALRLILARHCGVPAERLAFVAGPFGKPALALPGAPEFSLAHSHERALLAVAAGLRVGVDLERVRPLADAPALAAAVCSPRELEALGPCSAPGFPRRLLQLWALKEAYVKGTGEGLARPLPEVAIGPGGGPAAASGWALQTLRLGPGYVGALAVEGPARVVARSLDELGGACAADARAYRRRV